MRDAAAALAIIAAALATVAAYGIGAYAALAAGVPPVVPLLIPAAAIAAHVAYALREERTR
jgi:CHASE2 domain-containing sensor protein